jgi:hypothetical protein
MLMTMGSAKHINQNEQFAGYIIEFKCQTVGPSDHNCQMDGKIPKGGETGVSL